MAAAEWHGRHRAGRNGRRERLGGMVEIAVHTDRLAWFTPDSLASYLQVSDRLIRKWVAEGRLRSYKLDGCRRFDPSDVDRFVAGLRDERGDSAGPQRSAA
jgi:excisionase family DNA binding protein